MDSKLGLGTEPGLLIPYKTRYNKIMHSKILGQLTDKNHLHLLQLAFNIIDCSILMDQLQELKNGGAVL